ncbi:MAG: ChbG/HpnK family deacetylase [Planctomycetes bacterium]|nr:ChbG/HpnK family deacetylase [Planctomycetota bacterium]
MVLYSQVNGVSFERRKLLVIADDFGIGPKTSEGIVHCASFGHAISGTVLLVNTPFAEHAMDLLKKSNCNLLVGWHPNLTLDKPILHPSKVSTLVDRHGFFFPLKTFITRWLLGLLDGNQIYDELEAQLFRFKQLTGNFPLIVNTHQHIAVFNPVGEKLNLLFVNNNIRPWMRRVAEESGSLIALPGSRIKRVILSYLGHRNAERLNRLGFPGPNILAGLCDPAQTSDGNFYSSRIGSIKSNFAEWMCHPGFYDETLVGRDGELNSASIAMRPKELQFLADGTFTRLASQSGFEILDPSDIVKKSEAVINAA